jgi:hypothetical protein
MHNLIERPTVFWMRDVTAESTAVHAAPCAGAQAPHNLKLIDSHRKLTELVKKALMDRRIWNIAEARGEFFPDFEAASRG